MTRPAHVRRIVIVNDDSIARGGATTLALASVRAFRQLDIPLTYISGDAGQNPEFSELGVTVVPLGEQKLLEAGFGSAVFRGLYNPRTVSVIGEWIERNDDPQTVYHLHTWLQILSPSVFRALAPVKDRLIVSAHDFFLVCPNGAYVFFDTGDFCPLRPMSAACVLSACDRRNYGHKLWRVARQAVQLQMLRYHQGYPRVLAIHDAMREPLERGGVPREALSTLVNPIQPWRTERIAAERNREFVFVGRLDEEKGPDLAARAARQAGVPLRVIGDGPMMEKLRHDYPELLFSGRQPWAKISEIVDSARALVMPSRYPEPFGLVAVEALWSGLPVIAADTALVAPAIVERGAGLACNPRDENALAAAMRSIAGDDDATRRMSVNAFENTRDLGQTPEAWVQALLKTYDEVCSQALQKSGAQTRPPQTAFGEVST